MAAFGKVEFIGGIPWKHILTYFTGRTSLFRQYQNRLVELCSPEFTGTVVEIGCDKSFNYKRFFSHTNYICTNIARDFDRYLDVTNMEGVPDNSQDAFLCVSVLEHVADMQAAVREIHRTLRIGGKLLLVVPFAFRYHGDSDFWRFSKDAYVKLFDDFEIVTFYHLGGKFAVMVDERQKPRGKLRPRFVVYKLIGFGLALIGKFIDTSDNFPLGFGIYAVKQRLRSHKEA
jgi:SAM-dependent methyltransferase